MLALLASEIPYVDLERLYWRKDGTQFWGRLSGRRFHDVSGRELGLIGVIADITDRQRAEESLRRNEERWRSLVETSAAWIWETDANIRHTYTNAFVTRCLGYLPEEFLGMDVRLNVRWEQITDRPPTGCPGPNIRRRDIDQGGIHKEHALP